MYCANTNQKIYTAILISDRPNFRAMEVIRIKKRHFIEINGIILQEAKINLDIYVPNKKLSKYVRQKR